MTQHTSTDPTPAEVAASAEYAADWKAAVEAARAVRIAAAEAAAREEFGSDRPGYAPRKRTRGRGPGRVHPLNGPGAYQGKGDPLTGY